MAEELAQVTRGTHKKILSSAPPTWLLFEKKTKASIALAVVTNRIHKDAVRHVRRFVGENVFQFHFVVFQVFFTLCFIHIKLFKKDNWS